MKTNIRHIAIPVSFTIAVMTSCDSPQRKDSPAKESVMENSGIDEKQNVYDTPEIYYPNNEVTKENDPAPQNDNNTGISYQHNETATISKYYQEGYDNGYDDGEEDGIEGAYGENLDESTSYKGWKKKEYQEGYDDGYEAGFDDNYESADL